MRAESTGAGLTWAGLVEASVLLALLLTTTLAGALNSPGHTAPKPALSPATAALADGDDVRARSTPLERARPALDVASDPSWSY